MSQSVTAIGLFFIFLIYLSVGLGSSALPAQYKKPSPTSPPHERTQEERETFGELVSRDSGVAWGD